MKNLIFLGVICVLTASCVKNNDYGFKQAYIERAAKTCVQDLKADHSKKSEQEMRDYCECVLSKFVDDMSMDELMKYAQDDPKIEQKADKLLSKYAGQCLKKYTK